MMMDDFESGFDEFEFGSQDEPETFKDVATISLVSPEKRQDLLRALRGQVATSVAKGTQVAILEDLEGLIDTQRFTKEHPLPNAQVIHLALNPESPVDNRIRSADDLNEDYEPCSYYMLLNAEREEDGRIVCGYYVEIWRE